MSHSYVWQRTMTLHAYMDERTELSHDAELKHAAGDASRSATRIIVIVLVERLLDQTSVRH